jgi:NADPH2:quinone reductase
MALPQEMPAVVVTAPGGPDVLELRQRPLPRPGEHDLLIEVAAAGVNRADALQRAGRYRLPPMPEEMRDIPGLEAAGTVVEAGAAVTGWQVGDNVTALLIGGGYARYAVADARLALPIPRGWSVTDAASLPECLLTVWSNVFERGRLAGGETLLVHGGTSGIGTAAIQLATAFGARVLATAGTPEKCAACLDLGAAMAINYRTENFVERVHAATGGRGADVILDMVGGEYVERNFAAAAEEGRIVNVAYMAGARVTADLGPVMSKRLTLTGSTLRNRPIAFKARLAGAVREKVWPLLEAGRIRPVIDSSFPLAEAAAAHHRLESSQHIGKILLTIE